MAIRTIRQVTDGPMRLIFEGVSHTCRVYLDGDKIDQHHNAYTGFSINLPMVCAGEHELRLWISNEHGELSSLHIPNDYYNYGGISRPAEIQFPKDSVIIERMQVTPRHDGQQESHASGIFDEASQHPRYVPQTETNTRDTVLAHYNHPSIIIWGYLNECDS